MNWVDYLILAIVVFSALIGLMRGLVRELLSLATWVAALVIGWLFHRELADLLASQITQPTLRLALAFVLIAVVVLILGALLGMLLTALIEMAGLTLIDRLLGLAFGATRGAIIVAMTAFLINLTPLAREPWWQGSLLVTQAQRLAVWLIDQTPPTVQARLREL